MKDYRMQYKIHVPDDVMVSLWTGGERMRRSEWGSRRKVEFCSWDVTWTLYTRAARPLQNINKIYHYQLKHYSDFNVRLLCSHKHKQR